MLSKKLSAFLQLVLSCNACFLFSQEPSPTALVAPLYDLSVQDGGSNPTVRVIFSQNEKMFACHKLTSSLGFMSAASAHSELCIFNVESGNKVLAIPDGWKGFAFSPDKENFISWDSNAITVWSLIRSEVVERLDIANLHDVAYVKDGKWLVTQTKFSEGRLWDSSPSEVRIWNALTLEPISTPLDQLGPWYEPIVTPDGEFFVGIKESGCAILEVATGASLPAPKNITPAGQLRYPTRITANGEYVFFHVRNGNSVIYWDLKNSRPIELGPAFNSRFETSSLLSGQLHRFGLGDMADKEASFYADNLDGRWLIKDVFSDRVVSEFPDNTNWQRSDDGIVRILPTNRMLLSQQPYQSSEIRCFDLEEGKQFTFLRTDQHISNMALSFDGSKLAVGQTTYSKNEPESELISVWDVSKQKKLFEIERFTREQFYIPVSYLDFSPDSRLIVSATHRNSDEPEVLIQDRTTDSQFRKLPSNLLPSKIHAVSPDGKIIACSIPNEIHLLDSVNFTLKQKLVFVNLPSPSSGYSTPELGKVNQVAFSSNGKKLVAYSIYNNDAQLSYWNLEGGKLEALRRPGGFCRFVFVEDKDAIRYISFDNQYVTVSTTDQLSGLSLPGVESVLKERTDYQGFELQESMGSMFYSGNVPKNQLTICHMFEQRNGFFSRVLQFDLESRKLLRKTKLDNYIVLGAIAAERSNLLFVRGVGIPSQTAYIIDTTSGENLSSFQNSSIDTSSPDGKYVLIKDLVAEGEVRLCSSETGGELGRIKGPGLGLGRGFFSPSGRHFGISSGCAVSIWSTEQFSKKAR